MTDAILAHRHRLDHRREQPLVDARRDVLRAVHDHARQHGRERRAAVDPARPARLAVGARVDRQRVHADVRGAARHRAAGSATSSGGGRMFLFGVVVFGLSSLAIGFAPNDTVLVAFRAVQGVGAAFMMPATLSIITQAFPARAARHRDRHVGRGQRARARDRPGRRRLPHRVRQLAGDLLHQPADRRRRGRGDAVRRPRVARRDGGQDGRLRRHRRAHDRADRARARARRGQQLALGLAA